MTANLLTIEEYQELSPGNQLTELVRGRVVPFAFPPPRHGQICSRLLGILGDFLDQHDVGHLVGLSGIITERNPVTLRAVDVSFYSYEDVPRGRMPSRYLEFMPRLITEVLAPEDGWDTVWVKVAEFLRAGTKVVCVLDSEQDTVYVYHADKPEQILEAEDELALPEVLGDFRIKVKHFFE
jgi:Uma2 family endonuclease